MLLNIIAISLFVIIANYTSSSFGYKNTFCSSVGTSVGIRKWVGLKSVGAAAPPMIVNRMMRCLKSGQKHFQDLSEKQIFDTNIIDNLRSGHWKRYSIWRLASAQDNGIR